MSTNTQIQLEPLFKAWLPNWAIVTALVFCIIPSVMLLGLYNSNVAFAAGFLDVEVEDLQYLFMITYATLVGTSMIEGRLFRYFPARNYMLLFISANIAVLFMSSFVHNYYLLIGLRFLQGVLMIIGPSAFLQLLFLRIRSKSAKIIGYSVFYSSLLMSGTLTMNVVTFALDRYGWQEMIYFTMLIYIFILLVVLLIFNPHRHVPRYPLYQLDLASFLYLLTSLLSGAFVLIYGRKLYWFNSDNVCLAMIIFSITGGMFILRQLIRKRPLYRFNVFKFQNFRIGLLLFIVLYIFRAALNNLYATMSTVWQWEFSYIVQVQYINIAGIGLGVLASSYLLTKNFSIKYILALGFSILAIQFAWFTFLFYPDSNVQILLMPLFLQGFGVGWLFTPLVIFVVSAVPIEMAAFATVSALSARFWGTGIGFSVMQNAQYYLQRKHYTWFQKFVSDDYNVAPNRLLEYTQGFISKGIPELQAQQLAFKKISSLLEAQSFLLANMEIYTALCICACILVVVILLNAHLTDVAVNLKNKVFNVW